MSLPASHGPSWGVGDSLDRILDVVQTRGAVRPQSDGSYLVSCINPAHAEDRHPSLHITHKTTEHGGRTLLHCFTCGDSIAQEDWASWCGLEYDDLFDDRRATKPANAHRPATRRKMPTAPSVGRLGPLPKPIRTQLATLLGEQDAAPTQAPVGPDHDCEWAVVETYVYLDPDGVPVHRVVRQRCTVEGCGGKNFPQAYLRRGGDPDRAQDWVSRLAEAGWGSDWTPRLYRTPQLLAAIDDGLPVWVMEGEKDVHSAEGEALVATTNPGGAENFPTVLAEVLAAAAEINVVLDRDKAGWARGVRLSQLVFDAGGPQVKLWLPKTEPAKSDFTDHLQAGHRVEDLLPVTLDAVSAWHLLSSKAAAAAATIDTAYLEADAQHRVSAKDRAEGRKPLAADRRRYTRRWAQEALRQHARLVEATSQIIRTVERVPAGDASRAWAVEAMESAHVQLRAATTSVRATCELAEVLVPAAVGEAVTVAAEAVAATLHPQVGDGDVDETGRPPEFQVIQGGGGSGRTPQPFVHHDVYEIVGGEIAQVSWRQDGDKRVKAYKRIVNAPLRVHAREMAEADEDITSDVVDLDELGDRDGRRAATKVLSLRQTTHVVLEMPGDDDSDSPHLVRIPFDDWVSGAFLPHLPIARLDYNGGRTGREKVITAINHVSDPQLLTSYRATGWRSRPDGTSMYITAAGAIGPQGWEPIATNLTGSLARFDLPDPTPDSGRLRVAWDGAVAPMVDRFPDRVGAVLVGQAFRAALCPNEWVTVLSATPGVGKTALASLAMHFYGESWDRMRPMSSMSGNGATMNALRILAHQAKDAVVFLDDNAPTTGVEAAWKRLEETIRMIHNQEGRARSERNGQGTLAEMRPRTSGLITTELPPRAGTSGERRALIVPITKREIDIEQIIALDEVQSRHRRALVMSSYLQWVAVDHRGHLLRTARLREEFLAGARDDLEPRVFEQHARKVAELWAGWGLLLEFLGEAGALTEQDQRRWRTRIWQALIAAAEAADDPDLVESAGERACELIRFALTNGLAWVADADTGAAPAALERQLGWRTSTNGSSAAAMASGPEWRTDPRAICLGHVQTSPDGPETGAELLCDRAGLEAVIKAAAAQMPDTSAMDLGTVLRALEDEGVLKTRQEPRGGSIIVRRTLDRTIACLRSVVDPSKPLRQKRIVLRLAELFGEGDGPVDPQLPSDPPAHPPDGPAWSDDLPHDEPDRGGKETSVDHSNAGGLALSSHTSEETSPCAACGKRCGMTFAGIPLHVPCYWATTATTEQELRDALVAGTTTPATTQPEQAAAVGTPTPSPAPTPQPARPSRAARPTAQFRAAAAVVDVDAVYLPDGSAHDLDREIRHLGDLEQLGRDLRLGAAPLGTGRTYPQAGTIIPTAALWRQLGVDLERLPKLPSRRQAWLEEISPTLPAITDAVKGGWVLGTGRGAPTLKGATKLRRAEVDRGSVKILMTAGAPAEWGIGPDVEPARVARRLQLFADALGMPFSGNPLNTALDLYAAVTPKTTRDALTPVDWSGIPPALMRELEHHFDWTRTPTSDETHRPYVALFDRGQSYLATWEGLRVGVGAPEHVDGPVEFSAKTPGWWRITLPENTIGGVQQRPPYPDLLDPTGTHGGQDRWVTTPALAYAIANLEAATPVIHEAWIWPAERTKPALTGLCKQVRAALAALRALGDDQDAAATTRLVKMTYKQFSGYVISDQAVHAKQGLSQPYWFHATVAQARVGILHQILATGTRSSLEGRENAWPVVVSQTDLVGYLADSLHEAQAWPGSPEKLGLGPGQYKLARCADLPDHQQYLTGRGWSGQDHTVEVPR